jgi:hypothetical protein
LDGSGGAFGGLTKVGGGGKFGGGTGSRRRGMFGGGRACGGRPCSDPHPTLHPVVDVSHPGVDGCTEPFVAAGGCAGGGSGCDPQPVAVAGTIDGCGTLNGAGTL